VAHDMRITRSSLLFLKQIAQAAGNVADGPAGICAQPFGKAFRRFPDIRAGAAHSLH